MEINIIKNSSFISKKSDGFAQREKINIAIIVIAWVIMAILVNPLGEFPLNDDWVYAKATQSIFEKGGFTLSGGNSAANLVAQGFWGALFCLPFGFSFSILRISTLVLGLVGVLTIYGILRQLRANQAISLIGAFLIALNPIYFALSDTYMTDVPFFAIASMSFFFLIRGLKYDLQRDIIFGLLLSYLSILIRQFGIMINLAFAIAYLSKKGLKKSNIIFAITQILVAIGINLIYQKFLYFTDRSSVSLNFQIGVLKQQLLDGKLKSIIYNLNTGTVDALIYIGLFLSPLLIPIFLKRIKSFTLSEKKLLKYSALTFLILTVVRFIKSPAIMPLQGNIIANYGLGPLTLHDTAILNINKPSISTYMHFIWIILTVIGITGGLILSYYLASTIKSIFQKTRSHESTSPRWLKIFIVLSIVIYFSPLAMIGFFDRYLLFLIPLSLILIIINEPDITQSSFLNNQIIPILLTTFLTFGIFSISTTHDYLGWNRIRWQALNDLTKVQNISPHLIDGGYEFNGLYLFDSKDTYSNNYQPNPKKPKQSWWFVDKDDYMITFAPIANYQTIKKYSYNNWWPFSPKSIYVLHKDNA